MTKFQIHFAQWNFISLKFAHSLLKGKLKMNKLNVHLRVTRSTRINLSSTSVFRNLFSSLTSSLTAIFFLPPLLTHPLPPETFLVDLSVPPP